MAFSKKVYLGQTRVLSGSYCSILKVLIFYQHLEKVHKKPGSLKYGGVAQLGEHLLCKQGVRSSILLISTIGIRLRNELKPQFFYGRIAQVVRAHA